MRLSFSLITVRPRTAKFCMLFYLVGLYQDCPNYTPGVKIGPHPGRHEFCMGLYIDNFYIFLYQAMGYQIFHVALYSGPLRIEPKL